MFFVLSKVLGFFTQPSNLLIIVALLGALLLKTRFTHAGLRLLVTAVLLLALFGLTPLGTALIYPLEERFPPWDASRGPPNGIIIIGGALDEMVSSKRGQAALNEAAERITAAVELARQYPEVRILFSGGRSALIFGNRTEAEFAGKLLEQMGVAEARIALEDRSRNSTENAVFSKALAAPKPGERWLLVTSASHMPRAVGTFRRAGFHVEPYPVDWRTGGAHDLLRLPGSASDGLRRVDLAVHEWVGLLIYWIAGHTSELFPGPETRTN